jgi:hypothetical protein
MKARFHGMKIPEGHRECKHDDKLHTGGLARPVRGFFCGGVLKKRQADSAAAAYSFAYAITGSMS